MQMQPVTSSNIESIGHEGDTLAVQFKNGALWNYPGVTADTFDAMQKADSVGKFFNAHIKSNPKAKRIK